MRNIKFRIYDDQFEKMIYFSELNSYRSGHLPSDNGIPLDYSLCCDTVEKTLLQKNSKYSEIYNDMPIMQFTGLLDINGVEAYEGDIVKIKINLGGHTVNKEIIFENGGFCFKREDFYTDTYFIDECKFEIIGNIYKNPELLEVNK